MSTTDHILVVFNSNTSIDTISGLIAGLKNNNVLILSSHALFPNEKHRLLKSCSGKTFKFLHFGSFNSTDILLDLDKQAYEACKSVINYFYVYLNEYKKSMIYLKNSFLHRNINAQYNIASIHVFAHSNDLLNLGVSSAYWRSVDAQLYNDDLKRPNIGIKRIFKLRQLAIASYFFQALIKSITPRKFSIIETSDDKWVIHSNYRLKLKSDLITKEKWVCHCIISRRKKYKHIISLHESGKVLNLRPFFKSHNLFVAGDAYRPTIYPPYLFAYPFANKCTYIPKDRIDYTFFSSNGVRSIAARPNILQADLSPYPMHISALKTVILSLNHAGDWTNLISRSDTDILIEAFSVLASKYRELNFIIRMHPTMAGERAEGVNTPARIHSFVNELNLNNISISRVSLEEDWARGDLFISEYSLSVIDAIKMGKPGIFCNLTKRQSFMHDWEELGMKTVTEIHSIEAILRSKTMYENLKLQCQQSLERYNQNMVLSDTFAM